MILKKNITSSLLITILFSIVHAEIRVTAYGWEVFDRNTDSRISALAQSSIAYPIQASGSVLLNPSLSTSYNDKIGFTHQSKISGTANSEFIGFDKYLTDSTWISLALLYEGISGIPDTRGQLLDWGIDGIFGTFDPGEGNGILDEGERLDVDNIKFFSQNIFGLYASHSQILKKWRLGLGLKILIHTIDEEYGIGAGVNIGFFRVFKKTGVGIVFNNFPSSGLVWNNGDIELSPSYISFGIHHKLLIINYGLELNPMMKIDIMTLDKSVESKLLFDKIPIDLSAGLEMVYRKNLFFRFGLYQRGTFSSGIGFLWKDISIDYAFLNGKSASGIEENHLISISVSIDWVKKNILNKN
jgi:hypothetical protein